jgi:hypothetical protein
MPYGPRIRNHPFDRHTRPPVDAHAAGAGARRRRVFAFAAIALGIAAATVWRLFTG